MTKTCKNIIAASGSCLVTLLFLSNAVTLPFGSLSSPGEGFLPIIVIVLLLSVSLFIIGKEFLSIYQKSVSQATQEEKAKSKAVIILNSCRPWLVVAAVMGYLFVLDSLGFFIASSMLMLAMLRLLNYRTWWTSLWVGMMISGVAYLVFDVWFGINLPRGIFA